MAQSKVQNGIETYSSKYHVKQLNKFKILEAVFLKRFFVYFLISPRISGAA